MKNTLKHTLLVILGFILITASIFSSYIHSFIKTTDDFEMKNGFALLKEPTEIATSKNGLSNTVLELTATNCDWFNYYGIEYSSDCYIKATINYAAGVKAKSEDFFLEPSKKKTTFYSFVDDALAGKKGNKITSITFETLTKGKENIKIYGFSVFNREIPSQEIYIQNGTHKLGIDLLWGGALSYLEDLDSNVQAVSVDGKIKVDSNASERYNAESVNNNVNLINRNDTGRLVQQSYYGTLDYDHGVYMENDWRYNPVQGGNQFNDASKIVDLRVTENSIYIKCRPLDWAKEKQYITPSYMEAWYTLENGMMRATCRFVDYSGYPSVTTTQELPAFYCVEPLNNFVYYSGGEPWSDSNTKVTKSDLVFWGEAAGADQKFYCNENWAAYIGDEADSFGIGLYCPGQTNMFTGVFNRDACTTVSPATESPTSYIAAVDTLHFQSYKPISYCYYIKTGNVDTIRNSFKTVAQKNTDICNATNTNGFCDMCGKYVQPELNENNAYEISNMGELCWFRDSVNNGNVNANAVLVCDITDNSGVLTGYGTVATDTSSFRSWTPIGTSSNQYKGQFDGQGYTINGLYMNDSSLSYGGLFGYVASGAVVERVGVDYSYFKGNEYVGGIAGRNDGTINNCYSCYTVTSGSTYVGGITGYNADTVKNCYSAGVVNATNYVGGIAGENKATISNCYYLAGTATDSNSQQQNGIGASIVGATTKDTSGSTEAKTVEQFASGGVACLLQSANTEQLWGQKTNIKGATPVFDTEGAYKVEFTAEKSNYSLVTIGEIVEDDVLDINDFQTLVNQVLSDETLEYKEMLKSDIDGDGALDAIDCSLLERLVNNNPANIRVYLKGDFDFDGVPFTEEDIVAIKKALINQGKLTTRQKYACDLNFDGVLDIQDRDILTEQDKKALKVIFTDMETAMESRNTTANVIILCGQSNAYGASPLTDAVRTTVGNTDFSNIQIKYNNINTSDGVNWQTLFSNEGFETFRLGIGGQGDAWFGPEVGCAYQLATNEDTKDEAWYIIKYTAAGTFLGGDWLYDTTGKYSNENNHANIYNSLGGYLADNMVNYVNEALDEIESKHGNNINVRSFMWMQGESDAGFEVWANQYGDLQNILVNRVRTEFEGRDKDNSIGFVDGAIAAYKDGINTWTYSDTVNTHKSNNASLWYVPANTSTNVINKTTAGLYQNATSSATILPNSIWVDTSTCLSKLENNNENGENDGAHYCGDSMLRIGIWFAQGMLTIS